MKLGDFAAGVVMLLDMHGPDCEVLVALGEDWGNFSAAVVLQDSHGRKEVIFAEKNAAKIFEKEALKQVAPDAQKAIDKAKRE